MDLVKIGNFIKVLRKEKGITQEQLSEILGTTRRTVSRWETGSNLPDLDVLVEMADFFQVDLRELFDGKRKENELSEMEETLIKATEYTNEEKKRITKAVLIYFICGFISLVMHEVLMFFTLPETFLVGFLKGATFGLTFASMIVGILYTIGYLYNYKETNQRILHKLQHQKIDE